jgi:2-polyprenyl-6-methoxyphenol hydroxylase-like FAD-dependent oxidoreductase
MDFLRRSDPQNRKSSVMTPVLNRPAKRLRVTAAFDRSLNVFGSFDITAAEADSLERHALTLKRKHATQNADNRKHIRQGDRSGRPPATAASTSRLRKRITSNAKRRQITTFLERENVVVQIVRPEKCRCSAPNSTRVIAVEISGANIGVIITMP